MVTRADVVAGLLAMPTQQRERLLRDTLVACADEAIIEMADYLADELRRMARHNPAGRGVALEILAKVGWVMGDD